MPASLIHRSFCKQKSPEFRVTNNERPFIETNIKHIRNRENQNKSDVVKEDITAKISTQKIMIMIKYTY